MDQKRRETVEAGRKWIEFDLVLWRGDMNHTLRIDPETVLALSTCFEPSRRDHVLR